MMFVAYYIHLFLCRVKHNFTMTKMKLHAAGDFMILDGTYSSRNLLFRTNWLLEE
jgi:hypothetical protein